VRPVTTSPVLLSPVRPPTARHRRRSLAVVVALAVLAAGLVVASPARAAAAGSGTLTDLVADLPVATEDRTGYDRDLFRLWIDADGNGCDTREEVLIAESTTTPSTGSGCAVSGTWFSYYDEETWTASGDVDIDHVVPLAEVWDSGGSDWSPQHREDYANDLTDDRTLVAVTDNVNQSKGDQDPAEWMPPSSSATCEYVDTWVAVKSRWGLTVDTAEKDALASLAADCPDVTISWDPPPSS
jgi:hypothetical protein